MTAYVLQIGGLARLDEDVDRHLRRFRELFDDDELKAWRSDYERGRWVFVRLNLFADVVDLDGVTRRYDGELDALQFARPHAEDNLHHARETLHMGFASLVVALRTEGILTTTEALAALPTAIELDPGLREALRCTGDGALP